MTDGEPRDANYWLLVSGIGNFRASRDLGFSQQGIKSRHRRKAERMGPGDKLIFYVTGLKAIAGIVSVTSPYFESHDRIWASADPKKDAEDYPFRVMTEPDLILPEEAFVPAEPIALAMEYTRRWPAKNWTLAFQGNVHHLPASDYALIRGAVEQAASKGTGAGSMMLACRQRQWSNLVAGPDPQARFDEAFIPTFRTNGLRDPEGYRLRVTHVGARSGNERTTALAYYDIDGRTIVVAGNSGSPRHPAWYHNMMANPRVIAEKDGERWDGLATPLSGNEYAVAWAGIAEIHPLVNE